MILVSLSLYLSIYLSISLSLSLLSLSLSLHPELAIRPSLTHVLIPPHCQQPGLVSPDHTSNDINSTSSEATATINDPSEPMGQ